MPGVLFACKGVCGRYRGKRPRRASPYDAGLFRCSQCNIFMTSAGVRHGNNRILCRCCGSPVKTRRNRYNTNGKRLHELRVAGSRVA